MHILIYLSEQKYHLSHILHTQLNSSKYFFNCLEKNEPCSESLEQINLDGVKKQNKMYDFEVSIGLLPLFSIITKNEPCSKNLEQINLDGVKKWNKTYSFEVSIGLLPLFLIITNVSPVLKGWSTFV